MWRSSRPHIPKIGQIPGTRHYRNIRRHNVLCSKEVLSLRIDESLWFSNVRAVEDVIQRTVAERSQVRQVVLNFAALNGVDTCALESLELVIHRLAD